MGPVVVSSARLLANNSTQRALSAEAKASSRAAVGGNGRRRGGCGGGAGMRPARVCLRCWWLEGAFEVCASDRDGERSGVLLRIYNPERPAALIMHGYTPPQPSQPSNLEEKKKKQARRRRTAPSTQRPLQLFITPPSDSSILFICPPARLILIPPFVLRQFKAHFSVLMAVVSDGQLKQFSDFCVLIALRSCRDLTGESQSRFLMVSHRPGWRLASRFKTSPGMPIDTLIISPLSPIIFCP